MTAALTRGEDMDTHTHTGEGHVKQGKTGVMQLQAQEHQRLLGATRG